MTAFWSLAAVMSLLALLFILIPLLRPRATQSVDPDALNTEVTRARLAELDTDLEAGRIEQAQYDAARADLERELLHDLNRAVESGRPVRSGLWAAVLIAVAVPVGATLLYRTIGSEQIIALLQQFPPAQQAEMAQQSQHQNPQMSVDEMVSKLAARMAAQPDELEGWVMLARSYSVLGRYQEAVPAYRNILRLGGGDKADILADFADALTATNNGRFPDEAGTHLARALELEPQNIKALWLAGHWKNQNGDAEGAIAHWQTAADLMQPQSEDWKVITAQIDQVRQRTGLPAGTPPVAAAAAAQPAGSATTLTVNVALDPALRDQAGPEDTVFIFARAVNGPRMPLAIVRKQVKDLPVTVTLDDSMAMAPAMKLSGFSPVSVGARISKTGNAMPQSGDLQGSLSPVSPGETASVDILIDSAYDPATADSTPPARAAQASMANPMAAAAPTAGHAAALTVTVSLDPALAERTQPDDTVFIFARAVNGPRMPLAIVRKQVRDLPVTVTLDDSLAMTPAMVLSGFDPVSVGARISRTGNAMPQSGDLQGTRTPVSTAASSSLEITIDSAVP